MSVAKTSKKLKWSYLTIGTIFVIASILSFINPTGDLLALAIIMGITPILDGFWLVANSDRHPLRIVAGALEMFIGAFILLNLYTSIIALPFLFAIWIITNSMLRFMMLDYARTLGKTYFWISIALNLVNIILGIILLFNPLIAVFVISLIVGSYLALNAIECFVFSSFF